MKFIPLFFLPRQTKIRFYKQICYERLMEYWPVRILFSIWGEDGIEFPYKGDEIIWLWPWKRSGDSRPFVSVLMSGTGEWGDAKYWSLADLDNWNKMMHEAMQPLADKIQKEIGKRCVNILIGRATEDSRWNEETQSWEVEIKLK